MAQLPLLYAAPTSVVDPILDSVFRSLESISGLSEIIGSGLRQSFDEVIDGARTGRYCIEQLEKTEKTYIGTKVEIVLRNELKLERGAKLDNRIAGVEVDTKFSLSGGWMIPREAVGEICLLVSGDDNSGIFSVGLLRADPAALTVGANQDFKKSVSAVGKTKIRWLISKAPIEENFLLNLTPATRSLVLAPRSGVQRMKALFTNVTGKIIPRSAILQVGQQDDSLKRARELKAVLARDGFQVLCSKYEIDRVEFLKHGFYDFGHNDWLSIAPLKK